MKAFSVAFAPVAILLALLTASCAPKGNRFSDFRDLPAEGWKYQSRIAFEPDIADSVASGRLIVSLRHTNDYPYSNLWLEVAVKDSLTSSVDTLNIRLSDPHGRWLGHGIGTDFQVSDTLARPVILTKASQITLRHIMRVDNLPEVSQLGLEFITD